MIKIDGMNKIEKLQTIEALWDSLIHDDTDIDSPEWHRNILEARKNKIEQGTALFRSIDALKSKQP